jgi:hypothetical protein
VDRVHQDTSPPQAHRKGREQLHENSAVLRRDGPELLVSIGKLLEKLAGKESAEDINLLQKPLYTALEHINF